MRFGKLFVRMLFCFAMISAAGNFITPATAGKLTIGSLAPPHLGGCTNCILFQRSTGKGEPSYKVPAGKWKIISWSAQGGGQAVGQALLIVFRPTATAGQFKVVKQSAVETIPKSGHPSFTVNFNVEEGDVIGLATLSGLVTGYSAPVTKDKAWIVGCFTNVGDKVGAGTPCGLTPLTESLVNVRATLVKR
jgi:hypothetical protein